MGTKIDRVKISKHGFEVIETKINIVVCKFDIYHVTIKISQLTAIMNDMLVPTDISFKLNFVILDWLNRYKTMKAKFYVFLTNETCLMSVSKLID